MISPCHHNIRAMQFDPPHLHLRARVSRDYSTAWGHGRSQGTHLEYPTLECIFSSLVRPIFCRKHFCEDYIDFLRTGLSLQA
jgi:hypothetical protein